ncbi:[FeFe] hydrogenase H-cluster radical SAM maturase HydE [bacterium]|nr:[FeFe] hydrogenase H-cluster radical SAM maturase HydE [bacterium]
MKPTDIKSLIDVLETQRNLSKADWVTLIRDHTPQDATYLFERARAIRKLYYGDAVYLRGLIEFTNYCRNDCYYCGIRGSNRKVSRYRLSEEQILQCCETGYQLGFRSFVLQGGEDPFFTEERIVSIVRSIRKNYPDCAITLSIGEKPFESYLAYYQAGADRYLLRHETANEEHYGKLHPSSLTLKNRKRCLQDLASIGYQVGTGFMVGSPYQTPENLAEDMLFIADLHPQMVGIGPFIPHCETPFANENSGTMDLTVFMIGVLRLTLPMSLIPATTALGTIHSFGREYGLLAGANVVMPNLSPVEVRKKYALYDNKICTGEEAAECRHCIEKRINRIGYKVVVNRGDPASSQFLVQGTGTTFCTKS